ncbi:RNA polymerase sigma factor [Pollutimonas bauzanensis]|uniref:RNA polymerase sigma-70 factor, ECF subfamily n=1 Tax=Pollutimonas bauzanensis TaxID=658167 RepID=A0A1M5Z6Y0_9BURK|nr:sigma-70 family RNA polymerase sigma factor [Pollutimonas bauzanensis]SHI19848.1 RNA polymerase sigma-70 factor, ECF subfamily [Pollutimonas bauzanensis]
MSRRPPPDKGWLAHYRGLIGAWTQRQTTPPDAQDAAHDAVVGILKNNSAGILDQGAYLFRASQNRLYGEIRRQARHEIVSLDSLAEADHPQLHDHDAAIRVSQLALALEKALSELPLKCRQVFLWNKIEGYTQEEIAKKMGLSQSMVEKYMKRALCHVHDRLQDYAPD